MLAGAYLGSQPQAGITGVTTYRAFEAGLYAPPTAATTDAGPLNLGFQFRVTEAVTLTEISYYQPATNSPSSASRQAAVYTTTNGTSSGSLVATAVAAAPVGTGWQHLAISGGGVVLSPGVTYVATVYHPNGQYVASPNFFAPGQNGGTSYSRGPVQIVSSTDALGGIQGSFLYTGSLQMSTSQFNQTNYWTDITVTTLAPANVNAPAGTAAVSWAGNDAGVSTSTTNTVAFVNGAGTKGFDGASLTTTSLAVTLGSTAVGDWNLVWINAHNGTATPANITAPTGETWTLLGSGTDGASPTLSFWLYGRIRQAGDSTTPTWSWDTAVNVAVAVSAYSGLDATTPFTNLAIQPYPGTGTTHTTPTITTTAPGWIVSGFGDRSSGAYTATAGDTVRASSRNTVATTKSSGVVQDSGADVAAGSISRTVASPASTSVGSDFILRLNPGTTLGGSNTNAPAGPATMAWTAYDATALTGSDTNAPAGAAVSSVAAYDLVSYSSPLNEWLTVGTSGNRIVAHRGGSADFVEMTAEAYFQVDARKVKAIELSVWRTSDGVWVGSHDQSTLRMFGTDIDIPSNTYAAISGLTTTTGGYPIAKMVDLLNLYASTHIIFVDNKQNANGTEFLNILDSYPNATGTFVVKGYYTAGAMANAARLRGYRSWGYYYEADLVNLDSTVDRFDILGLNYDATGPAWTQILAKGKPVLAHVILTAAQAATGWATGAHGLVSGKIGDVVPNALAGTSSPTVAANGATISLNAQAGQGDMAWTALGAQPSVGAQSGGPAQTYAAQDAGAGVGGAAGLGDTIWAAQAPASSITAPADVAPVSWSAADASTSLTADTNAPAGLADTVWSAFGQVAGISAPAEAVSAVTVAYTAGVALSPEAGLVTMTWTGQDAGAGASGSAQAEVAQMVWAAQDAGPRVQPSPATAVVIWAAQDATAIGDPSTDPHQSATGWAGAGSGPVGTPWTGPGKPYAGTVTATAGTGVKE